MLREEVRTVRERLDDREESPDRQAGGQPSRAGSSRNEKQNSAEAENQADDGRLRGAEFVDVVERKRGERGIGDDERDHEATDFDARRTADEVPRSGDEQHG